MQCGNSISPLKKINVYPINILHVISKLPVGGVENLLLTVLQNSDRHKFFPVVCSLSDKGEIGKEIEELGVEVFCLHKLKHRFDWTIVKNIYNLIKQKNINVVFSYQYHANLYGRLAARLAHVPCIIASVHNVYTIDRKIHRRIINKYLGRFTDKIVAVSKTVKDEILRYDGVSDSKVEIIYNGIDINRFLDMNRNSTRNKLGIALDTPVIGTVGRLTFQKGQRYLLEAVHQVKEKFPQIVLLMVGDGPMKDELRDYAKTLNVHDTVIFTGTRRDIPSLLAAMDIFVLSSLWEGLSISLIEAMAAGKPVIATDIPPFREVVNTEKIGILIPPKHSEAIADAIELLLRNKNLAESLGMAARERAFSAFNIETTIRRYTNIFEDILRSKEWDIQTR
jgi:glycosyltransferase involved in cell wall biosynthesis